jgi:hypothetical protein
MHCTSIAGVPRFGIAGSSSPLIRATIRNISRAVRFVGRSSEAKSMESNGTLGAPWQYEQLTPSPLATTNRMNFTTESRVRSAGRTLRFFGFSVGCAWVRAGAPTEIAAMSAIATRRRCGMEGMEPN